MGEIIKVPDILIYKGGALHSLRDQKMYKDAALQNFGPGCGVVKGENLYVLDESDERVPIVTMVTAKQSVSFTVNKTSDIEVDWGDGIRQMNVFSHTFTNISERTIRIYGSGTALSALFCDHSQMTTLDVSQNTALTNLVCHANLLTTLDVSQNTALTSLICSQNQMTTLDVSQNTALTSLKCQNNLLTTLDVNPNTALIRLECGSNQLTTLDVSLNTALVWLSCNDNLLATLDVSLNTTLNKFIFPNNPFLNHQETLFALANSICDRTGMPAGSIVLYNESVASQIRTITDSKNWQII